MKGALAILTIMEKIKNALKSANKFGLALILLAATLFITQNAFTPKHQNDAGDWYYNGNNYTMAASWDRTQDTEQYSCQTFSDEPCKITVPAETTLQDYLNLHSGNILAVSDGRREEN